jgi:hypothetical protein
VTAFRPYEILESLRAHGVRYVVVGGFAAVAHGSPLPTSDIDITPALEEDNLTALSDVLRDLDARIRVAGVPEGVPFAHDARMLRQQSVLNLVTRCGDLDLVLAPAGVDGYDELAAHAVVVTVHGVPLPLASLADVVRSKEAANRPKDQAALPVLRALLERQAPG